VRSTPASPLPYAVAFGLLPSVVTRSAPGAPPPPRWATAAGALLGLGAHVANVLPDLVDDERAGIRGLTHRLGAVRSERLADALLLGASVVLATGPTRRLDPLGAVTLAGSVAVLVVGSRRSSGSGSRAAFGASLAVAGLDVALLLARGDALTPTGRRS
jgi:protoheme IX farnesyltransferase